MAAEYLTRRDYLQVRDRLAVGDPREQIAEELALAPATVAAIASGELLPSRIVVDDDHPLREEMLTATRCAGCGALVFTWPCLACQLAARRKPGGVKKQRLQGESLKNKLRRQQKRAERAAARRPSDAA